MNTRLMIILILIIIISFCGCSRLDEFPISDNITTQDTGYSNSSSIDSVATPTTEYISLIPSENFIGSWYLNEAKDIYIRITQIDSDKIKFDARFSSKNIHYDSSPVFTATAILQDGVYIFGATVSPEYIADGDISGKIIFDTNTVTMVYDSLGNFETDGEMYASEIYKFTIKNEIDILSLPTDGLHAPIRDTEIMLKEKGWKNIEIISHEPDSLNRWGVVLEPYKLNNGEKLYCITGRTGKIFINVYMVFGDEYSEGYIAETYYVHFSGLTLHGIYLDNFIKKFEEDNKILDADNQNLLEYFNNN